MADSMRPRTDSELVRAIEDLIGDVEQVLTVPAQDRGAFYGPYLETLVELVDARIVNAIMTGRALSLDAMRPTIVRWHGLKAAAQARLRNLSS